MSSAYLAIGRSTVNLTFVTSITLSTEAKTFIRTRTMSIALYTINRTIAFVWYGAIGYAKFITELWFTKIQREPIGFAFCT